MRKSQLALVLSFLFIFPSAFAANSRDTAVDAQLFALSASDKSNSDGKAKVYAIEGKVLLTSAGSPVERELKVGDEIKIGDSVYTEKGASLSIGFDTQRNNAVRIPAESKATFTSIEPTDIKLEDGSIFSVVNGLAKGSTWKVTTPSAVAAVRGTVYLVRYESSSGEFYAATVNVPDDGKDSAIEIQSLTSEGQAEVIEGKEILLKEGETPSNDIIHELSIEKVTEVQQFFKELASEKERASEDQSRNNGNGPPNGGSGPGGNTGSGTTAATTQRETGAILNPANAGPMLDHLTTARSGNDLDSNTAAGSARQDFDGNGHGRGTNIFESGPKDFDAPGGVDGDDRGGTNVPNIDQSFITQQTSPGKDECTGGDCATTDKKFCTGDHCA